MVSRIIPLALLLLTSILGNAQTPQGIQIQQSQGTQSTAMLKMACADQFAGTISFDFANFNGESNDIDLDTIFFCFNDQIEIMGNGDADLTGDPFPLTDPGVAYGFYNCPPTISGPDFSTIINDPCFIDNPDPNVEFYVTSGGQPDGSITFANAGQIQTAFGGGGPILIWFAPLTVDDFGTKTQETDGMGGPTGPCMNVNTDAAFAVVYLNEIVASNPNTTSSTGGCVGTFDIAGGLPEYDGSNYDITVQLVTDPTVTGTVMAPGGVTHGDEVTFTVPQPGIYSVTILDEKSCPETILMDFNNCQILEMEIGTATVAAGGNVCVEVIVNSGFSDIISTGWSFSFDETLFAFTGEQNINPNVGGDFSFNQPMSEPGKIIAVWFNGSNGENLPDGSVFYELCFDAIGAPGNCSTITFTNDPFPAPQPIEIIIDDSSNLTQIGFDGTSGEICIDGATIGLSFMQTPASCPGEADGDFTVGINGGTAPYQLQWQAVGGGPTQGPVNVPGNTFTTPMNQSPGCYSVTVTDISNTMAIDTVCVEAPAGITILLNENPPLCNGDNGNITAQIVDLTDTTIVTDVTNYQFMWSNGSMDQNTGPIPVGIYSVTVTQPNGCTEANSTALSQPAPFDVDVNITSASCSGIDDGEISITVAGATPDANNDYTINWPTIGGGLTFMNNVSNVTGLEPNGYPLNITDDNGCFFTDTITVDAIKTLSVNAIVTDVLCNGTNTGSIFAVGMTSGAAADEPYIFQWFGAPPPPPPTNTPPDETLLSGLAVGTYNLVMTDAVGCEIDTTFEINEPEVLEGTLLAFTPETCNVGNDGTATVGVTGGTFPYSYDWGPGIANDSIVDNLSAGMYTVTIEDANLCMTTVDVTITQPIPPMVTMFEDDTLNCPENEDGSLTVVVDDPASIISYDWMPNVGDTETVTGLSAGEYIVTITANDGCVTIDTALVIAPEVLTLDSVVTMPPICPGDGNGQISLFVSGGTAPYFYDWPTELDIFDGAGNSTAGGTPVVAGTYMITVLDANLCDPLVVEVTLEDPPSIVVDFSNIDSVSCFNVGGFCDGGATATAMYSDGNTGIFNFTWSSGEADNSVMTSTASQLCLGDQIVTVSDGTCSEEVTVFIPSPDTLKLGSSTITNVSCTGSSDGSLTVEATGGTPPYTYFWSNNEAGPTISNLAPGEYVVAIEDDNGCNIAISFVIEEPDPFVLMEESSMDISCNGFEDGQFIITYQGGTTLMGNPTYTWSNGIAPASSSIAQNLAAGTYSVTGTDDKGCQAEFTFTITEPDPIGFRIADIPPINCFNESTFITVDSAFGGANTSYSFEVDNFGKSPLGTLYPIFAGEHTITVYDEDLLVGDGCFVDTIITITEPAPITVDLPTTVEIELGDTLFQMTPTISATTQIDSFLWTPIEGLMCPNDTFMLVNCPNPVVNITESTTFSLTIIDENGCEASDEIFIEVDANRNVFIPNIFSPNDDGRNDIFRVYTGLGVENINYFRVFNRWGSLMYDVTDIAPSPDGTIGWDGRFNGERLDPDVFVYIIEVTFFDGQTLLYRGDVTLLR